MLISVTAIDAQENGTCAALWPLYDPSGKVQREDMLVKDLAKSFDSAAPLTIRDILLNKTEAALFKECLIHTVARVIVTQGGSGFKKYKPALDRRQPFTAERIQPHKTPIFPLGAWQIDESTINGNAEVGEIIMKTTHTDIRAPTFMEVLKIFAGDQLSLARLRALVNIRAGHIGGFHGFRWGVWMPGFFHGQIADVHGTLYVHWGKPNSGDRNPGSLWFHNSRLDRHPITLTSLPPYRTCRDLIFVSLYARILHCLLEVSGKASLEDYLRDVEDWETLEQHAREIYEQYANNRTVQDLRDKRAESGPAHGDMVYENALLFLRDALITREFADAVKAGDSGRVVLVLKTWTFSFRGNGRTKYAHEMLHLIHNLTKIWPKPLWCVIHLINAECELNVC